MVSLFYLMLNQTIFFFNNVSTHDVMIAFNNIKFNAICTNGISSKLIKLILPHIIHFYSYIHYYPNNI